MPGWIRVLIALASLGPAAWSQAQDAAAPSAAAATPTAATPSPAPESTSWRFAISPYAWALGVRGDISADRVKADFDTDFSDLWDDTNFAAMARFDVRRDRFFGVLDALHAEIEDDDAGVGPLRIQAESRETIVDTKIGYQIWSDAPLDLRERGLPGDRPQVDVELLGGARYVRFHNDLELSVARFGRDAEQTFDWVDAVIGFQVRGNLGRGFSYLLAADVGGFGIGSASRFTWQGLAVLGYRFSNAWTVSAGYKTLQIDRRQIDFWEQGPVLALTYAF
jgi:hypothetical protein